MQVRDLMTTPVITVRAETSIKAALGLLDQHAITALPVVADHERLVGIVSEADLIRDLIPPDLWHHVRPAPHALSTLPPSTVGEVMNTHPITVAAEDDLVEAVDLMTTTRAKSLPVVDGKGRVVGVVSRKDVVHVAARPDEVLAAELADLFVRLGRDWLVDIHDGVATVSGPVTEEECAAAVATGTRIPGVSGVVIAGS